MGERPHPKQVENYTTAVLIMVLVNLLWIFTATLVYAGFGVSLLLAAFLYLGLGKLERYIQAQG